MKKYVKPELVYERYELTEQIAACAWDLNHDEGVCGFVGTDMGWDPNWIILGGDYTGNCVVDADKEIYCYYNGPAGMNTFNS